MKDENSRGWDARRICFEVADTSGEQELEAMAIQAKKAALILVDEPLR